MRTTKKWEELDKKGMFPASQPPPEYAQIRVYYKRAHPEKPLSKGSLVSYSDFKVTNEGYKAKLKGSALWQFTHKEYYVTSVVRKQIKKLSKLLPIITTSEFTQEYYEASRDKKEMPRSVIQERVIGKKQHETYLLSAFVSSGLNGLSKAKDGIWKAYWKAKVMTPQYYHLKDIKEYEASKSEDRLLKMIVSSMEYQSLCL